MTYGLGTPNNFGRSNVQTCCWFDGSYLWIGDDSAYLKVCSYSASVWVTVSTLDLAGYGFSKIQAIHGDGTNVYIACSTNSTPAVFDTIVAVQLSGSVINFGDFITTTDHGNINSITCDVNNNIWVATSDHHYQEVFSFSGTFTSLAYGGFSSGGSNCIVAAGTNSSGSSTRVIITTVTGTARPTVALLFSGSSIIVESNAVTVADPCEGIAPAGGIYYAVASGNNFLIMSYGGWSDPNFRVVAVSVCSGTVTSITANGSNLFALVPGYGTYVFSFVSGVLNLEAFLADSLIATSSLNQLTYGTSEAFYTRGGTDDNIVPIVNPPLPDAPALISPSDGSTEMPDSEVIMWAAATGATGYDSQVSLYTDFSIKIVNITNFAFTSYMYSSLYPGTLYYWRVRSRNASGPSAWSTRSFTTAPIPAIITLSSPSDTSTTVSLTPTLSWVADADASNYHVQISTVNTFASTVRDVSGIGSTSYATSGLSTDVTYYWRVQGATVNGTGPYSAVWSFKIIVIPATPLLATPTDASNVGSTSPMLSWNAAANSSTYQIQVSTVNDFSTTVYSVTGISSTNYTAVGLTLASTYYWRVRGYNSDGYGSWSSTWSFSVVIVPAAPTLISPSNGVTGMSDSDALHWYATSDTTSYNIQLATDSGFSTLIANVTGNATTTYSYGPLSPGQIYYWRVSSTNSSTTGAWSTVWHFTTLATPSTVTLLSPTNSSSTTAYTPTLSWNSASNAQWYHLQVSTVNNFASTVIDITNIYSTSSIASGLSTSTTYYWRVQAINANGAGSYSSTWSFSISPLPSTPTLGSPSNSSVISTTSPNLSWYTAANSTSYELQIATTGAFSTILLDVTGLTSTSYATSGLSIGATLYWRVRGHNSNGDGSWSAGWNFTIIVSPSIPALWSPADLTTGTPLTPSLIWYASLNSTAYHVQVASDSGFSSLVVNTYGVTSTSYSVPSALTNGTTYWWRVEGTNAIGASTFPAARSFVTILLAPDAPVLTAPADAIANVSSNPTLSWTAAARATSYNVQISVHSDFSFPIVDTIGVTGTSLTVNLSVGTTYYWRVSATNTGGNSSWTSRSFTTQFPPGQVVLASPENYSYGVNTDTAFSWNAASGAITYEIQISKAPDFSVIAFDISGLSSLYYEEASLDQNSTYYWRVLAINPAGSGPWSDVWKITTLTGIPRKLYADGDSITSGSGTVQSPWTYRQVENYFDSTRGDKCFTGPIDGDLVSITGHIKYLENPELFRINKSLNGSITIDAWDLAKNGPWVVDVSTSPPVYSILANANSHYINSITMQNYVFLQ